MISGLSRKLSMRLIRSVGSLPCVFPIPPCLAGVILVVVVANNAESANDREQPPAPVASSVDFFAMTQHSQVPLDESWYDRCFANCKRYNLRRVYWRVALGRAYYRSRIMARVSVERNKERRIVEFAKILDGDGPEPLELAIKFAHRHGVELIAWFPFNETHYYRTNVRYLVDPWYSERQHLFWCDRDGRRVWMGMPCIAEPEVVARTASIIEELCAYGVDGIYLPARTHCYRPYTPDDEPYDVQVDQFGFNEPVRRRYQQRFGVDIRHEEFDIDAWQRMKGEFYTEFLTACADAAHRHGKLFLPGTSTTRLGFIPNLTNRPEGMALRIYNDWTAWHQQAKVDGIVAIQDRLRLPRGTQQVLPHKVFENACDVSEVVQDVPGCPVSLFYPVLAFRPAEGKSWSMKDRLLIPPDILKYRLGMNQQQGATELILHEGYMALFLDTRGEDPGIGPGPNMNYWEAVGQFNLQ